MSFTCNTHASPCTKANFQPKNDNCHEWHRIGLVWDGSCRLPYVDGVEVAKDAAPLSALKGAEGGLYFGVGSSLAPGSYFSGLIDDVRIYNRAVKP